MNGIRRFFRLSVVILAVISSCLLTTDIYGGQTLDQLKAATEAAVGVAVGEALPPGVGDIVNALNASPDVTKRTFSRWLDTKIEAAVLDDDWDKVNRYQAFKTCIDTGDCKKLQELQKRPPTPTPDKESPLIMFWNPSGSGAYSTTTSSVDISGTASDNVGVIVVTWSNDKGGSGICTGTDNWSAGGITLQSGQNVITVTATDAAGNKGTDTITVTYAPPDKTTPTVKITSPTVSGAYSAGTSPLDISGTASDNVGVKQVTWSNDKGGSGTCTGTDNWSASGITLQDGQNVITVTAYDAAGNSGTDTITVTYTPPDKTTPTVKITSPTVSGAYSAGTSPLDISGTASDNVGVKQVTWSNDKGGSGTCTGTDNWSASGITLQDGQNVITVTAYDAAGNSGTDTITVTYTPPRAGIKIQKVANAKDVRPGEWVTYTYSVTNTGEAELDTIKVADDKCSPLKYLAGDTNGNNILDTKETWTYECSVALNATTQNTATAEGYSPTKVKVTDQATAAVTVGPCPPGKVQVPYLLYMTRHEAIAEIKKKGLVPGLITEEHSTFFNTGTVMEQTPRDGECVDPGALVHLVISKGPKKDEPPKPSQAKLTAELDCGGSFELAPGGFPGRSCGIIVRGWESNTERRVVVKVDYNKKSGIEIFPGDTSAPPSLMYTAGIQDTYDRYIFSEHFTAKDNATQGTTTVTITVSQESVGSVTLTVDVAVLNKGLLPSSGPGIRPPASVAAGSGGEYCVWRYKLFGDPPPCFHFVAAVCTEPRYNNPRNGYELVGSNMTWGEADARVGELSSYFDDAYGCRGLPAGAKDTDGDGTPDDKDGCPTDAKKTSPGICGCGTSDKDSDYDGTPDCVDKCPDDINKTSPGVCGCGEPDKDSDGDGALDCNDECPSDPDKKAPGECGCWEPDVDSDKDGALDCNDTCPNDPNKIKDEGYCGCGKPETDKDGDAWPDCIDNCPNDPYKTDDPGLCGCGKPETDSDNDGVPGCKDKCPNDPNKTEPGTAGCGKPEKTACPAYDPTNPACEPGASSGGKPPVDPNIGSGFQEGMPGGKPPVKGGPEGGGEQQPETYTQPPKPEGGEDGGGAPAGETPPLCYDAKTHTYGPCPSRKPPIPVLPPKKPEKGGGKPKPSTSPAECPSGCHMRPDGSGCHCPEGGSGDSPPSSTAPPSTAPPPSTPPSTSTPSGGGGG